MNAALAERVKASADALRVEGVEGVIPADAVTASGSGLDPHISPRNAELQVARIAAARGATPDQVRMIVAQHTEGRALGILGQPRVNVLETNLALDAAFGGEQPSPQ